MIIISKVCALVFLFAAVSALKDPIMKLDLTLTRDHQLVTTFSIGSSEVKVFIDINYQELDICCKNANTIFKKIYYFFINPFVPSQDYLCKSSQNSRQNDTAVFSQIGPINIAFNEVIYPKCQIGILGFSKKSQFLSLMPISEQFFRMYPQSSNDQNSVMRWKLQVGGTIKNNYQYFTNKDQTDWNIDIFNIKFDGIQLVAKQTIRLVTNESYLTVPSPYFSLIRLKLIDNYQCQVKGSTMYCPCTAGISTSFPKFDIFLNQALSYRISQGSYLYENDEICQVMIRESDSAIWQINIMLLDDIDILFDYKEKRIGIANHIDSVAVNDLVNQPIQLILNCAVVLLMCFFVAMVLIEIIKQIINIEGTPYQSFETYMMKHTQ